MSVLTMHPSLAARLDRLTPDQRTAATSPPGPILCVAPAGSGKTTTLVARIAWLVDGGTDPATIAAITFNARAAAELRDRLDAALGELGLPSGSVRVRTFHALGREILIDAGVDVGGLVAREDVLRDIFPELDRAARTRLDTTFSHYKLNLRVRAGDIEADPEAGAVARAFVRYEEALGERDALDFDDLVRRTLDRLAVDPLLLGRWRARCLDLLVDEVQDVDRSQLDLALLLAAPSNRIFLVGDDDQSIYGWRLADVRRVLALETRLPGLRRVDLEVNHRCPGPVVERAVRLVEHNLERFAKIIRARSGAVGRLVLAPDVEDEPERSARVLAALPDEGTMAILARTNRELRPAIVAAIDAGVPFRAPSVDMLVDDPLLDSVIERVRATPVALPLLVRVGSVQRRLASGGMEGDGPRLTELAAAVLAWAPAFRTLEDLVEAIDVTRRRLTDLRRDDARLALATAHSTKGAEFDHVAVIGLDVRRFPSARAVGEALDPDAAMEEERRLAYVAWTRARRTLVLSYDPMAPSRFLLEAFSPDELGIVG